MGELGEHKKQGELRPKVGAGMGAGWGWAAGLTGEILADPFYPCIPGWPAGEGLNDALGGPMHGCGVPNTLPPT